MDQKLDQMWLDIFVMRGINSHLNFDLDIAKEKSEKNLSIIFSMQMLE